MGIGVMHRHGVMAEHGLGIESITAMYGGFAPQKPWGDHPGGKCSALASARETHDEHPADTTQAEPADEEEGR